MFSIARVQDIIIDASHTRYEGEFSVGTILYTLIDDPPPDNIEDCQTARPLNFQIKQYPIPNEIVFLINAPSPQYNEMLFLMLLMLMGIFIKDIILKN